MGGARRHFISDFSWIALVGGGATGSGKGGDSDGEVWLQKGRSHRARDQEARAEDRKGPSAPTV